MENLPFRHDLKLQKKILLGTEIEAEGFNVLESEQNHLFSQLQVPFQIDTTFESHKGGTYEKWIFSHDSTVTRQNNKGVEVISPISYLNPSFLDELEKICAFLETNGAYISEQCSAHIHFDFRLFLKNIDALKKFILIMSYYEPECNRFFAGEEETIRPLGSGFYAKDTTKKLYLLEQLYQIFAIDNLNEFLSKLKRIGRYHNLNFMNANIYRKISRNTIELRSPNGSLNPVILENNIYFLLKIVEYCLVNSEWHNLYYKWYELQGNENRIPEISKARKLSRTILTDKTDLRYFDWQYEKAS
jgi:hypothetical protein